MSKVWLEEKSGLMFHDTCFEPNESRAGFIEVDESEVEVGDACDSCGAEFIESESDDDDDADDADDEEEESQDL